MTRTDRLGTLERTGRMTRTRGAGDLEERRDGIGQRLDVTCNGQRLDVLRKLRPAVEAMLARDNQLRVGERECLGSPGIGRVSGADVGSDALRGGGIAGAMGVAQFFRLFLVLLEVRTGRQIAGRHTNLLSQRLESARSG
jgi:hypothetical protein